MESYRRSIFPYGANDGFAACTHPYSSQDDVWPRNEERNGSYANAQIWDARDVGGAG